MTGSDIPGYLDLYDSSWPDLVKRMPDIHGYKNGSIQRTWKISFDKIKRKTPGASNLLQLMALFDCNDIWVDLIMNGNQGSDTPRWFRDITKSKINLLSAIGSLADFSLLQKGTKADSYSMHPVVQQWVSMSMNEDLAEFVQLAITAIAFTAPLRREPGFWMLQTRLAPHADKFYRFVSGPSPLAIDWQPRYVLNPPGTQDFAGVDQQKQIDAQTEHPLLRLGWLYFDQQLLEKALAVFQFGRDILQNTPGEEHPLVFLFDNCLAWVFNELGDFEKSESLATTALDGYRRHFGDNNKWTFDALSCLSQACFYREDYKRAIELGEALLSIARKDPNVAPNVLSFRLNNLSVFYSKNGQLDKAIKMSRESLELLYNTLEPDHPDILKGLENLAWRYMEVESYTESERIFEKCIKGHQRVFGPKSIRVAREQELLARVYQKAGRLADAEELYRKAVEILENAQGAGREDTCTVRCVSNLCHLIFRKWEQAHPFGIDEPAAEPASLSDSALRQPLIELCRMMLNYPGQSDMLNYVAKMLFRYDDVYQSRVILQGQAKFKDGSWSYSCRICDGINSEHMVGTERFVCMACDDLDLCRECMAVYQGRELDGWKCIRHSFLDVSLPSPANSTDYLEEAQKVLRQILEDYSTTKQNTVETSMAEGSRTKKSPPLENTSTIQEVKGPKRSLLGRFKI
jgi:tetratricopeptide (TPR) repeat protein